MDLYLGTPPNGQLFWADAPAAPGQTLRVLPTPDPLSPRRLWVTRTPELVRSGGWPRALWRVRTDEPVDAGAQQIALCTLTVLEALDPALSLGPCAEQVLAFFASLESMNAARVRNAQEALGEEWAGKGIEQDEWPQSVAQDRASTLADELQRGGARDSACAYAQTFGEQFSGEFFYAPSAERVRARQLHSRMRDHLADAVFLTTLALVVSDQLDLDSFRWLTEDWRRLTGETLAPASNLR